MFEIGVFFPEALAKVITSECGIFPSIVVFRVLGKTGRRAQTEGWELEELEEELSPCG